MAMHWVVVGAGAVGCYFGGMLARAGQQVTLVARPQHVQAVAQRGLRVQTAQWDEHIALHATTDIAVAAQADVVLCCVKSTDTEATGALLRPLVKPGTPVLSLQNGVDNAPRLAALVDRLTGLAAAPVMLGAIAMIHWPRWSFVPTEEFPLGGMEFQVLLLGLSLYWLLGGRLQVQANTDAKAS
jgi:2-dehydropantoate 2-reductase